MHGFGGVFDAYAQQGARLRVHRGSPELFRVHLTKTLEATDHDAVGCGPFLNGGFGSFFGDSGFDVLGCFTFGLFLSNPGNGLVTLGIVVGVDLGLTLL